MHVSPQPLGAMSNAAISVHGLGKRYRIGAEQEEHETLMGATAAWLKAPLRNYRRLKRLSTFAGNGSSDDVIWALQDVSFDVACGEVVGVIGANGAGKSTLLKVLSRITEPTCGHADLRGRVASLLEVGTGFHPELTGRENIFLNGTVLGMSKAEVERKFDAIVDFAGVERFIDTPVKRFSSGMQVRLAFAVAAHLEPEILLVDEVLAVGDAAFQKKCLGKMDEVTQSGRTVLFVSHQMGAVQELCERTLLFEEGRLAFDGPTEQAVSRYLEGVQEGGTRRATFADDPEKEICLLEAAVTCPDKPEGAPFDINDALEVHVTYRVRRALRGTNLAMVLRREGVPLFASFDIDVAPERLKTRQAGTYRVRIALPQRLLKAGRYTLDFDAGYTRRRTIDECHGALAFELGELREAVAHASHARTRIGALIMPLKWRYTPLD